MVEEAREAESQGTDNAVDRSVKSLFRLFPFALLHLLGATALPARWRWEDTAMNVVETRADQVLIIADADGESAIYLECQLQPRADQFKEWLTKRSGLTKQLGIDVSLVVVYLTRGGRASFPDRCVSTSGGIVNTFVFPTVRLWEHREEIASGELAVLAPLLVLCEEAPTAETIREEIGLIRRAEVSEEERLDLLAIALRLAGRRFSWGVLEALFRAELPGMRGATIIDDWILVQRNRLTERPPLRSWKRTVRVGATIPWRFATVRGCPRLRSANPASLVWNAPIGPEA